MVYVQFTWCYGGNQVFLFGSFDGWAEHRPMVLVEGSSTIFQTICDLPPGYHKFRFLVDGVWRVNEQLLFTEDDYGTNNVILVKQPELNLIPEAGQPAMGIDGFVPSSALSGAPTPGSLRREPGLSLSAAEIGVSRERLSMHLSLYKMDELIPNSGKVFVLDVNVTVEDALFVMHEQALSVVPLWNEISRQISGMLTASDFILILLELQRNGAMITSELLESNTISAWKEGKLEMNRKPLIQAGPDETLREVAFRILQNQVSAVPVLNLVEDTTCPQLLHIACLAGILKHICRHFNFRPGYVPLLQQPVGNLPLGAWTREVGGLRDRVLLTLLPSDLLTSAFKLLIEAQVSSIPIVDDKGSLLNIFSRSDITSLAKDNAYVHIQLDRIVISQVLNLVGQGSSARYRTCKRSDSLFQVMHLLSDPAVRRIVVVEAGSRRVEGIITLRDVFSLFLV